MKSKKFYLESGQVDVERSGKGKAPPGREPEDGVPVEKREGETPKFLVGSWDFKCSLIPAYWVGT